MIRIVSAKRLALLEADTHAAFERARLTGDAAQEARGRHARELSAATERAERAETATTEVSALLSRAVEELSAAQQDLLLKDIEIRRLREELAGESMEGQTLTVLLRYGEPHTVYASREDAYADTATHGGTPGSWQPCDERPPAAFTWRCEAFIYDAACNGFRRASVLAPAPVGEAA
ncbi:hypothetical protein [Streptomyces sp. NPDC017988]|uniref:hypothetical protein n=1 Tax=Streptomyces sp. NPDC017988 TaxID=3365025 RepID=UPI0037A7C2EE